MATVDSHVTVQTLHTLGSFPFLRKTVRTGIGAIAARRLSPIWRASGQTAAKHSILWPRGFSSLSVFPNLVRFCGLSLPTDKHEIL